MRYGEKGVKQFTVTRGEIPTHSVTATYMLDDETGYIRIKSFGETTYQEMLIALAQLSQKHFGNLIIDLRDNMGGYLESAVKIINEFLPRNQLIVYTEGRKQPRKEYRSDGRGSYQDIPLIVLINETSASASEIVAGAMQDNDRATIIGRRSFGKGLVQQPLEFTDGSMIRLTIARYYTPSGRCIQKPYVPGEKSYEEDLLERYEHGEFFSQDSIKHTGPAYHTRIGREVYGGGGITPDLFVPEDTLGMTSYYKKASMSGLILQFAFKYTDENRQTLNQHSQNMSALESYLKKQNIVDQFATYADKHGLQRRNLMIQKSYNLLERFLYSRIIYNIMDEDAWIQYLNQNDPVVKEAIRLILNKEVFPKKPAEKNGSSKKA